MASQRPATVPLSIPPGPLGVTLVFDKNKNCVVHGCGTHQTALQAGDVLDALDEVPLSASAGASFATVHDLGEFIRGTSAKPQRILWIRRKVDDASLLPHDVAAGAAPGIAATPQPGAAHSGSHIDGGNTSTLAPEEDRADKKRILAETTNQLSGNGTAKKCKTTTAVVATPSETLANKLRRASKADLVSLLSVVFHQCPEARKMKQLESIKITRPVIRDPPPGDPLLKECFNRCCMSSIPAFKGKIRLYDLGNVKACGNCKSKTYNRTEVMDTFELKKSQADKIPRGTGVSNWYGGGKKYVYHREDVISYLEEQHGSMYAFLLKWVNREVPSTGDLMSRARDDRERKQVILNALEYSSEQKLKNLVKKAAQMVPELQEPGGIVFSFSP